MLSRQGSKLPVNGIAELWMVIDDIIKVAHPFTKRKRSAFLHPRIFIHLASTVSKGEPPESLSVSP